MVKKSFPTTTYLLLSFPIYLFLTLTVSCWELPINENNSIDDLLNESTLPSVHKIRHSPRVTSLPLNNFVATDTLTDGEQETRIYYDGITAKETSVSSKGSNGASEIGLRLWQVSDGIHFIQLIFGLDGTTLQDCEYLREKHVVEDFLESFQDDLNKAKGQEEIEEVLDGFSEDLAKVTDFKNVTFRVLKTGENLSPELEALVNYKSLRSQCKQLHRKLKKLVHATTHGKEEDKILAEEEVTRRKRDLNLMTMMPGTLWCGSGNKASTYDKFGAFAGTDHCCREHDHCPFTILPFSERFNQFNYRIHTMSHCDCDDRFRSCLKMTNTAASNMVGKVFFNVVQTKCFMLKPSKVCSRRSWWGKCTKFEYQKKAYLRDPIPY